MTAHKHAALIAQYAQDALETDKPWERWELRSMDSEQWQACGGRISFSERCEYRRKPRTMTYTVTIQDPLREAPEVGEKYWLVEPYSEKLAHEYTWAGDEIDMLWLNHGLCFATKEDAIAAAKAMLPVKGEQA